MDMDIESFYCDDEEPSFLFSPEGDLTQLNGGQEGEGPSDRCSQMEEDESLRKEEEEEPLQNEVEEEEEEDFSQSQRIYSGLLSRPEFDVFDISKPGVLRDVKVSEAFQPYTLKDFLTKGPKTRPARGSRMKKTETMSRQTKTFHRRLMEYKPILENKIAFNDFWRRCKKIKSILSMSTLATNEDAVGEVVESEWGWDDAQGVGFRVYDESIVLVGYIVKQTPPDLGRLHERCKEIGVIPIPLESHADWCLYLEDETGRIRLGLTKQREERVNFDEIVSGVPVALMGNSSIGKFWVEDILYATPNDPEWPIVDQKDAVEMVFVSGLNFSGPGEDFVSFDLLMDYLEGLSGSSVEQNKILKHKTRVFFVGNIFPKRTKWDSEHGEKLAEKYANKASKLDGMLEDLARTMEVFIMPGKLDLTHHDALPQPPFHRQLFAESAERPTFQRLSNPAQITVSLAKPPVDEEMLMQNSIMIEENLLNIVLTSGTNVKDTMDNCEIECPLNMCAKLLEWGHLHPTSLADHDLAEESYCLKGSLPHLYIVGGLCEFGVKIWNGVKIIGVPSFADTGMAVTLTRNCDIVPINFKVCSFSNRPI